MVLVVRWLKLLRKLWAGEIDFKESFRRRAALLKGMPEQTLAEVAGCVCN